MEDIYEKALLLHKTHAGKLETNSKIPLDTKEALAQAYSPGVARVSEVIGENKSLARDYTLKKNTIAIISDGSAILGLGNLGAHAAIPVMEGKAAICKEFAGVDAFPICIETQDTEEIIATIKNIAPVFGGINLEDIAAPKCFEIEARLKEELNIPVMHDDQWGAATITLSGVINALALIGKTKEEVKVVLSGIGAAGVATARLLLAYGITHIIFCDSKGVVYSGREGITTEKQELLDASTAHPTSGTLGDAVVGADIFIGLSKPHVLTEAMVHSMNEKPVIFALANPYPEIDPEAAKDAGAYIVATGRSDYPNQINNSVVFPGFWRGVLDNGIVKFDTGLFVAIAVALAQSVQNPTPEKIIPTMWDEGVVALVAGVVQGRKM